MKQPTIMANYPQCDQSSGKQSLGLIKYHYKNGHKQLMRARGSTL